MSVKYMYQLKINSLKNMVILKVYLCINKFSILINSVEREKKNIKITILWWLPFEKDQLLKLLKVI